MAGLIAGENIVPYMASKHGVVGITKGVGGFFHTLITTLHFIIITYVKKDAATYAKHNIRINCICPGYDSQSKFHYVKTMLTLYHASFIKTPLLPIDEDGLAAIAGMVPMRRIAAPEEVCRYFAFICDTNMRLLRWHLQLSSWHRR
jgi:NAD(P)-dependent dehydrogenase (short-subunit alcohol dehydrogenase family)